MLIMGKSINTRLVSGFYGDSHNRIQHLILKVKAIGKRQLYLMEKKRELLARLDTLEAKLQALKNSPE